jgi:hypothetical protein
MDTHMLAGSDMLERDLAIVRLDKVSPRGTSAMMADPAET